MPPRKRLLRELQPL